MPHFYISAANKSSGKTTLSIGLCAALTNNGHIVQPFKKGPDYIDPIWLSQASGRPCHNLDFNTQNRNEILHTFNHYSQGADICLIEGNKGLYDGMDLYGSDSNAAMAKLLEAPVVLVLDTRGTIRGVAPLLLGYQAFDSELNIAGVILNQVGGSRHEAKLQAALREYTNIPVLGAVHRNPVMNIDERHLGLMPGNEDQHSSTKVAELGRLVGEQVDLQAILNVASTAPKLQPQQPPLQIHSGAPVRIAVARDASFGFYYPGDLEVMQQAGAELVELDTLHDTQLPEIDGLFIGGGFPETQMQQLEANTGLRAAIHAAIEAGLPTYAECGGLMYLSQAIIWQGERREMVGIIPADAQMCERPQGRGYIHLRPTDQHPWPHAQNKSISAHEFHYSRLEGLPSGFEYAYSVERGTGIDGKNDGLRYKNLLACYAHMRNTEAHTWALNFVEFVRQCKRDAVHSATL